MATYEVSPTVRGRLRQFLTELFSLSELKNLCFDLGVDYELFPHQTKGDLSRELLAYYERTQELSCLVAELVKQRQDEELVALLAELESCSPRAKVQIVLPGDKLKNRKELLSQLAQVLGVSSEEVMLIATAPGSIRLLVSLPAEAAEKLVALNPERLGDAYEISSIRRYESLSGGEQSAWRKAALRGKPAVTLFGLPGAAAILVIVVVGALVAGAVLATAAAVSIPRATVTNRCSNAIRASETLPVIGEVTIELAAGATQNFRVPPGAYQFRHEGQTITVRAPIIGQVGPYRAPREINASYKGEFIGTRRFINDSVELGGRRQIVLCPSGR